MQTLSMKMTSIAMITTATSRLILIPNWKMTTSSPNNIIIVHLT